MPRCSLQLDWQPLNKHWCGDCWPPETSVLGVWMSLVALLTNFVIVYSIMYQLGTRRANEKESEGTIFTHNEATGSLLCVCVLYVYVCANTNIWAIKQKTFFANLWKCITLHSSYLAKDNEVNNTFYKVFFSAMMLLSYSNNVLLIVGKVYFFLSIFWNYI